jgi:hypothetical protein
MINSRHVSVLRPDTGGNYSTLMDFMKRRKVMRMPFAEAQTVAVTAAQYVKIDSTTHIPSGVLTVLKSGLAAALTNGGVCAAELAGAVGTAATTTQADSLGNILNLVFIRDSVTHSEVKTASDSTVFGLVQCTNGVAEGAGIGAAASENTQLSFVYIAADGSLTLAPAFTQTIEFQVNKLYMESHVPTIFLEGGNQDAVVVEPKIVDPLCRVLTVTGAFAANEVITLSTGGGAGSGTSTATGDTVVLDSSSALFNANSNVRVRLNGVQLIRGVEAIWDSTTTMHVLLAMDVSDVLEVEVPVLYN